MSSLSVNGIFDASDRPSIMTVAVVTRSVATLPLRAAWERNCWRRLFRWRRLWTRNRGCCCCYGYAEEDDADSRKRKHRFWIEEIFNESCFKICASKIASLSSDIFVRHQHSLITCWQWSQFSSSKTRPDVHQYHLRTVWWQRGSAACRFGPK